MANAGIDPQRQELMTRLFPEGIPPLWCPPLTHYDAEGSIDRERISVHLRSIAPSTRGWLVPGSTGDGWEMNEQETEYLLDHILTVAAEVGARVLIGVLRQRSDAAEQNIRQTLEWLRRRQSVSDPLEAMISAHVCGFTVCPPTGEFLSQDEIRDSLADILDTEFPIALYQLPQVTRNEMTPATVENLASRFSNFYLLKDTSGQDRVALSNADLGSVFLVRGAEGGYAHWLKSAAGPYDGFLLSTANVFARQYAELIRHIAAGDVSQAQALIGPVEEVVRSVFDIVNSLPDGNAFTNANKAMDHVLAFGSSAARHACPRLHAGSTLPQSVIAQTLDVMQRHGLMPEMGYAELVE